MDENEVQKLKQEIKQLKNDIHLLKDNCYNQSVKIKVLEDSWKEYHSNMEALRYEIKLIDVGQKWFKKSKVEHKEKVQGNLKGLSTK